MKSESYSSRWINKLTKGDSIPHSDLNSWKPSSHAQISTETKMSCKTKSWSSELARHSLTCTHPIVKVLQIIEVNLVLMKPANSSIRTTTTWEHVRFAEHMSKVLPHMGKGNMTYFINRFWYKASNLFTHTASQGPSISQDRQLWLFSC